MNLEVGIKGVEGEVGHPVYPATIEDQDIRGLFGGFASPKLRVNYSGDKNEETPLNKPCKAEYAPKDAPKDTPKDSLDDEMSPEIGLETIENFVGHRVCPATLAEEKIYGLFGGFAPDESRVEFYCGRNGQDPLKRPCKAEYAPKCPLFTGRG